MLAGLQAATVQQIDALLFDNNGGDYTDNTSGGGMNTYKMLYLIPLGELVQQQYDCVVQPLEDNGIQFGSMKTIEDFSDSDCQLYFRFLKVDLLDFAKQLCPRLHLTYNLIMPHKLKLETDILHITRHVSVPIFTKCCNRLD